jgi:hypothetical protein
MEFDQLTTGQLFFLVLFWLTPNSLLALIQERSVFVDSGENAASTFIWGFFHQTEQSDLENTSVF